MTLANANTSTTTDADDWWDRVTDAYAQDTPFNAEFNDGKGSVTTDTDDGQQP
ncbi:MAG TPA: hypothetical protein PLE99_05885 [Candidatus Thiothrix moscowensis]|mgnify:CR=1 FL=1|uniref:hypothetical protein n=1 Tax=unclassified Thiothrix TaxID=2636184 RepID=UPI0025E18D65|nr:MULTISPECIES: hypothetical protein [unclassified Thiothrix]HRJ52275.1 hypothetical protein [Candidatus Thiothrix moscowensis]HRJ92590.1 hypothetical protein [Candidatus Thiothrix moscowensis]